MEVRPDILANLLCSVCGEYLSCEPVRTKKDGSALCGRCCDPEGESTLHFTPYEHLAEMLLFPCANKKHGCTETLYMEEMKNHEAECAYRQFVCPVTESGQCDWSGAKKTVLAHCKEQHPDKLLQNAGTIHHQINESNRKIFLLEAFKNLFSIQCKVCIVTKTIYHSVRIIGKCECAVRHEYVLKIINKDKKLSINRDVALALQEDTSVQVDFNTVLKLGEFKDTTFTLKVGRKCTYCKKPVFETLWPTDCGWCCKACAPATRQCRFHNAGCSYRDTKKKVSIHELYFCPQATRCKLCQKVVRRPRERHYKSAHSDITHKVGVTWRAPIVYEKTFIITSDVGITLWCDYVMNDSLSLIIINMHPSIHTEQVLDYTCYLTITNPATGYTLREDMCFLWQEMLVWEWCYTKKDFQIYVHNNEFKIKFELKKKQNWT